MRTGRAAARGYTLIEMVATVAIAGIVTTTAVPRLGGWVDQQRVKSIAGELATDLQYARSEAVLRNQTVRITFEGNLATTSCYLVHTGAAGQCQCASAGPARCEGNAQALKAVRLDASTGATLQSNARSVLFAPEHGTASPTASLRVTGAQGRSVQHAVNLMGRVRSCSPEGNVSGYRSC